MGPCAGLDHTDVRCTSAVDVCHSVIMVVINDVVKMHSRRTVLHHVSFTAASGKVTGFVGPNGSGKSSTLRILLGLDRPNSGATSIGGMNYRSYRHPLRIVGSMLDGPGANPMRSARAHLSWVATSNKIPVRRVSEVLEQVGLAGAEKQRIGTYSLGMGQRLGLAVALLGDPEYLVLDEPVNGLDPEGVRWMRDLLKEHADMGGTVLLSSHLMSELAEIADDIVVISQGRITAAGSLADITEGYSDLESAFFAHTKSGASA
ncbi:ABC-2 type transport system ATP-binding protein [Actinomyces denticolens]|uniref:ABC-2 type transport system ATP-binding protein n=3 Tax=Actinomycetaceae TaxID=2049 RepID=A0ABY1HY26_9ACTO|nr:ABC-2 type transport system ATP-binding protein [Actinomyces denticolens]SUU74292.1 Sulfate/thiosulfate import ATP-binding protein CysA [Actinomyces denticolens]